MLTRLIFCLLATTLLGCGTGAFGAQVTPYPTFDPSLPFPIPASCPQSAYHAAANLSDAQRSRTSYWMGTLTLALGHLDGGVWRSGDNRVVWLADSQPSVEFNPVEGRSPPATITWQTSANGLREAFITFPKTGCWEMQATTPTAALRLIVYIYPARYVP